MSKTQTPPARLPESPAPAAPAVPEAAYPARARVRSNNGEMRHLFTGDLITPDSKVIDIDGFAIAQIEADKWSIVTD